MSLAAGRARLVVRRCIVRLHVFSAQPLSMSDSPAGSCLIPISEASRKRPAVKATPKGRALDPHAQAEVAALLGDALR